MAQARECPAGSLVLRDGNAFAAVAVPSPCPEEGHGSVTRWRSCPAPGASYRHARDVDREPDLGEATRNTVSLVTPEDCKARSAAAKAWSNWPRRR